MTVLTSNQAEQTESAETIMGPGAQLRKQRELHGLDQARVAAELHLSESMIEALEWDDFDALPGVVFTQGYLRNYARLLGVPEKEILAAYQRLCPEHEGETLSGKRTVKIKQEVRSSHGLVQLTSWFIVIGLIALLVIWWQGRLGWQDVPIGDLLPEAEMKDSPSAWDDAPFSETSAGSTFTEVIQDEPSVPAEVIPQLVVEDQPELTTDPQSDDLQPETEPLADAVPVSTSTEEDTVTLSVEATPVVEDTESPAADEALESASQTSGQLVVEFTGRCWAEVRDATGEAHILGEKRAGIRYELEAALGPFKVVLGDASAVRMTLNGEPYDLAPHTSGNVARFTLETGQ